MTSITAPKPRRVDRIGEYAGHSVKALTSTAKTAGDLFQVIGHSIMAIDPRHRAARRQDAKKELREGLTHTVETADNLVRTSMGISRELIGGLTQGINGTLEHMFRRNAPTTSRLGKRYNQVSNRLLNTLQGIVYMGGRIPMGALGLIDIASNSIYLKATGNQSTNTNNGDRAWQALGDIFLINSTKQGIQRMFGNGKNIHTQFQKAQKKGRVEIKTDKPKPATITRTMTPNTTIATTA